MFLYRKSWICVGTTYHFQNCYKITPSRLHIYIYTCLWYFWIMVDDISLVVQSKYFPWEVLLNMWSGYAVIFDCRLICCTTTTTNNNNNNNNNCGTYSNSLLLFSQGVLWEWWKCFNDSYIIYYVKCEHYVSMLLLLLLFMILCYVPIFDLFIYLHIL